MEPDLIDIMEKIAGKKPARIVVCEGWDERCLKAAADVMKKKLAEIVLLGDPEDIKRKAGDIKADISRAEIVDFRKSELKEELAQKLAEARKHKGMAIEEARKLIEDESYFGCTYALCGYADGVAGSAICSTAELMRPALQILREKGRLVSEVTVIEDAKNSRMLFVSDISLNIDPSPEELAQITLNAVGCVRGFGIEPKAALLSFSTKGSGGDTPETQKVRDALAIVKEKDPGLMIDGELQVDAAVNREAAKKKCPDSPLKGEANILIFPNLTAANICAHALLQMSDIKIALVMDVGLAKPVSVLGRSTPAETVRNLIVSCAMQVNSK